MISNPKVLVIDDDNNICELIRLYLEKENFEVVTVNNGLLGIEEFKNMHHP